MIPSRSSLQLRLFPSDPRYRLHQVRALPQNVWVLRCVKTPFLPLSRYELKQNIVLAWCFYLGSPFSLHHVQDGNIHLLPSVVCPFLGTYFLSILELVYFRN